MENHNIVAFNIFAGTLPLTNCIGIYLVSFSALDCLFQSANIRVRLCSNHSNLLFALQRLDIEGFGVVSLTDFSRLRFQGSFESLKARLING